MATERRSADNCSRYQGADRIRRIKRGTSACYGTLFQAARWRHPPLGIGESNVRCLSAAPGKANSSQVASPAEVHRSPRAPGSSQPSERYTAAAQALARPERTAQEARVRGSCCYLAATNFLNSHSGGTG